MFDIQELVGWTVTEVLKHEGDLYIRNSVGRTARLAPTGDCCAVCFIQHVSLSDALIGTWRSIEDIATTYPEEGAQPVVEEFGHRITTDKGVCSIEMRVEHNGYYGGTLECRIDVEIPLQATPLEDF